MSARPMPAVCACAKTHLHGTRTMYDYHSCRCGPCAEANSEYSRQHRKRSEGAPPLPVCTCRAGHRHGTYGMFTHHGCHCGPCTRADVEFSRDYKRRTAGTNGLPVCDCTRPVPHEHGTRGMYAAHRCPCAPCTAANTEYSQAHTRHRPRVPMADADTVRARIAQLRAAGMTMAEIAFASGVTPGVLDFAVYGRNGRPPAKVRSATLAALTAIGYKDALAVETKPGRRVNGDIARRQVQSLYSFGWSGQDIADRLGVRVAAITYLLRGNGTTEEVRAGLDRLYPQLHGTNPPQDTARQRSSATLARNRAAVNGWTADTATDHEYARYAAAA